MHYLILFVGVISFLSYLSWRFPEQSKLYARQGGALREPGPLADQQVQAADATRERIARLLAGERKEDKPCLTPIDCVQSGRCAGHCGCR